jgi:signal peptidase
LKIGDIIVFKSYGTDASGNHATIVHRVAEIITDQSNGQKIIRTKGDANPDSGPGIDYPIFDKNYIGKVVYVIPKLGEITNLFRPPANYILIGVILIFLIYYLRKNRQNSASDKRV